MNEKALLDVMDAVWTQTEVQKRNGRAWDYIERTRRTRLAVKRWWDAMVQRALLCGGVAVAVALLLALVVTL